MTESETELETIDRLEAALIKIAAAQAPKPPAAPDLDRDALKQSLDSLITRLRAALAPLPAQPIITE